MINKKFMLMAVFLVGLLAVSAVSANDLNATDEVIAEEIAVDDSLEITQDDALSTTHTVSGNTFEDIQNVINLADEGDTISLSGLYGGNGNNVKISKKLTIEGNGAILDAHRKSEIFEICGKNVVVNNVTFINGYNACGGAIDWWTGIYNDASNYNGLLTNSRFINCRANLNGGAVYMFSNGLTMKNCYFEGNFAKSGGAVYVAGNFSAIENCTFFNNFYLDDDLDGVSVPDGLALVVNLEENDVFTEYKTDIKDCKYLNDPSAVKYLLSSYSENEGAGDGNYIVPKYKLSGNVVSGNTFADIQKAIENARPGDVVELSGTYKGNGTPIEIHRGITVVGVGQTTLDADGLSSIFSIESVGVSLFNLKLTNGYSSQNDFFDYKFGGAINAFKNYLYIGNTIFENNNGYIVSTLHSVGDYTVLNNCTFRNNGVGMTKNTAITLFGYDDCGNSQDGQYTYQSTSIVRLGGKNSVLDNCVYNNNIACKDFSIKNAQLDEGVVKLSVPSFVKSYGDSKQLELTLTEDGKPISNGKVSLQIGHDITKTVYTDSNGKASVDLSGLSLGTYMIVSSYNDVLKVSVVVVEKYVPSADIKASDVTKYYGGSEKYTVTLTNNGMAIADANVKISIDGKAQTVKTNSKGQASVDLNLGVGNHDVIAEYENAKIKSKVTVKSTITASDMTGIYSNSKATATFLDTAGKALASKQVTFKIGSSSYPATTNSNGVGSANIPLSVGTYTVTAVNPTTKEEKQFKLTISKASSTTSLAASQSGKSVTLTATVTPSAATGKVTFEINGKTKEASLSNGKASATFSDLSANTYPAKATYSGDSNLKSSSASASVKVDDVRSITNVGDTKGTYLNSKVSATFLDANGKALANTKVIFRTAGKTFSATTNSNGAATAKVDLGAGDYNVVAVNPATKEEKQFKLTIDKATPEFTLKAGKSDLPITADGKPVVTITATFSPNTVTGEVTVSSEGSMSYYDTITNGQAVVTTFYASNVAYDVIVSYSGDNNFKAVEKAYSFNVSNAKPVLTAESISFVYGNAKDIIINLNDDGTPIADKDISLKIYIDADRYYSYSGQSDENGQLKVSTKGLGPNNYLAYINSEGCKEITAKITIKKATPKITASKKTFKVNVKTKKYTITLKTNMNKVMKNKKVTLKVNGKTYKATTNSKGKATFKITKLTKKGKFNAVIKFAGNSYYKMVTKTIRITVKK